MKKGTKIFVFAISLALLLSAVIGLSANAESTAPEIVSKNINVNGNYCLMLAVDPATAAGDDVTVTIYDGDPANGGKVVGNPLVKAATATEKIDLDGDGTKEYDAIVFTTSGVSAKDIADVWYITTTSGGITSEPITYSVREYLFERLYKNGTVFATSEADGKAYLQRQFYLEIIDVATKAQQLLVNRPIINAGGTPKKLVEDYTYVYVQGGSYTAGDVTANRGFVDENTSITLTADDAATNSWRIFTFDKDGVEKDTLAIDAGTPVTVSGNTVIVPYVKGVTPGLYFDELGTAPYTFTGLTYKNLQGNQGTTHTAYLGHSGFSQGATVSGYSFIADCGDEHGAVFSVYKPANATKKQSGIVNFPVAAGSDDANCVVFEFDVKYSASTKHMFTSSAVDSNGELSTTVFFVGFFSNTLAEQNSWSNMKANSQFSTNWSSKDYDGVADDNLVGGDAFRIEGVRDKAFDILPDKWYNICYEIYPTDNRCVVYVDGVRVADWGPTTFTIASGDIDNINLVGVMLDERLIEVEMFFDNVYAGKIVKEYVAP